MFPSVTTAAQHKVAEHVDEIDVGREKLIGDCEKEHAVTSSAKRCPTGQRIHQLEVLMVHWPVAGRGVYGVLRIASVATTSGSRVSLAWDRDPRTRGWDAKHQVWLGICKEDSAGWTATIKVDSITEGRPMTSHRAVPALK